MKKLNIYFAGSIRAGRDDQKIYSQIINYLRKYGRVLSEHIGKSTILCGGENLPDEYIFHRDMMFLRKSDVMVSEVTLPSLGVGYEIGKTEYLNKRVLCLYRSRRDKRLSAMIAGNKNLTVKEYRTLKEAFRHIDDFFKNYKSRELHK